MKSKFFLFCTALLFAATLTAETVTLSGVKFIVYCTKVKDLGNGVFEITSPVGKGWPMLRIFSENMSTRHNNFETGRNEDMGTLPPPLRLAIGLNKTSVDLQVQIYEVKSSVIQEAALGTGALEGKRRLSLSPRETGFISNLHADQGDMVKAGTLLVEMDSKNIIQQIKIAEAEQAIAQAALLRIDSEINSAKANFKYAESAFKRSEKLLSSHAISRSSYDENRQNMLVAQSALEQVEIRRTQAEASLVKHQAQIALYKTKLAETRLTAPFDALILRRNREQGAIVNPGTSIMDIVDTSSIMASVWVDESRIAQLQNGLAVSVLFHSLPQQRFAGRICRLWRETDRETRKFKVDIALEKLPPNWTFGQQLEVFITDSAPKPCINIPVSLITWKNNQPFVLAIVDKKIIERPVKLGIRNQNEVEILSGLQTGDKIVMMP